MPPFIKKTTLYENQATKTFVEKYSFQRFDGTTAAIEVSPSLARDRKAFRARLLDAGAILPPDASEIDIAVKADPMMQRVYAARTGWLKGKKGFVLQNSLLGESVPNIVGIAPMSSFTTRGKTRSRGNAKQWSETVGRLAEKSTTAMFTISTALAAPLLKIVAESSFGICLNGSTGGGKTLATVAAGSVIGIGNEARLPIWYSTVTALEPYLPAFNDCLFPIDDLSKLDVRTDHDRYLAVRDLAYKFMGGDIKGRHHSFTNLAGANGEHYTSLTLTSAEKSIQEMARDLRQERMGGERRRLIDVPAYFGGLDHIFDRAGAQDLKGELFHQLISACARNHGAIYRQYLRRLLAKRTSLRKEVLKLRREFCKRISRPNDPNDLGDLARKFGLIYAAGSIGISSGLLPWRPTAFLDSIIKCYLGARSLFADDDFLRAEGRQAIRAVLKSLPALKTLHKPQFDRAQGYMEKEESHYRCILRKEVFSRSFVSKQQHDLVLKSLLNDGIITAAKSNTGQGIRPKEQFTWPDKSRHRSYELRWPRRTKQ